MHAPLVGPSTARRGSLARPARDRIGLVTPFDTQTGYTYHHTLTQDQAIRPCGRLFVEAELIPELKTSGTHVTRSRDAKT